VEECLAAFLRRSMLRHMIRYEYVYKKRGFPGAGDLVYVTIRRGMFDEWAIWVWRAYVIFDILELSLL
jgi:hypothetical protein